MRFDIIKLLSVGLFLTLLGVLVKTQIFSGNYYRSLADDNRIKTIPIHAPRGIIYDRNDVPLVTNLPAFRYDEQTISKDQAIILETEGKFPEIDSVRSYLKSFSMAHVLDGVERQYQEKLRGINGKELVEVDAIRKKLRVISTINPVAGNNLILTIDASLQKTAHEALKDKKGVVIVSKPDTGEILTLVSMPSFDQNNLESYLSDSDQPLFNRAISGTYPPGSTFKIITAVAGLETGMIKADTLFEDTGVLVIGPYKFPNWKWLSGGGVDGWINVTQALQKSNDVFFYQVGEKLGIEKIVLFAKKFGLGGKLGVDLPQEAGGSIKRDREWFLGDTFHMAIGQGDLLVTPLQVNVWTNVIANGGKLCKPYVAKKSECKDLGFKKENIEIVKKGMEMACQPGGTGYPLFSFKPQVYCKTGTAEFGIEGKTHAWFTSFSQDISVTVLVEGAGEGSDIAAPIAKKILEKWLEK